MNEERRRRLFLHHDRNHHRRVSSLEENTSKQYTINQKMTMRAVIVSDEFGKIHESHFESLREARIGWRTLSFKYASVLFVQLPDGSWEPFKKYGLPEPVNALLLRQKAVEFDQNQSKEETKIQRETDVLHISVTKYDQDEKKLVFTQEAEEGIVVDISKFSAFFKLLIERDLYFREDPRTALALNNLENMDIKAAQQLLKAGIEHDSQRVKAWLNGFKLLIGKKEDTFSLSVSNLQLIFASGAARIETILKKEVDDNGVQIASFSLFLNLPAHGLHLKGKPERFNTYATLYQELLSVDQGAILRCRAFPRRHLRSRLARIGAGLPDRDLRLRNDQLTHFLDDLFATFPVLSSDAQLVVIQWIQNILHDSNALSFDAVVPSLLSTTPTDQAVDSYDDAPKRPPGPTHRSSLSTIGDAIIDTYEQVKTDILGSDEAEETIAGDEDDSVLIFRLSRINGLQSRSAITRAWPKHKARLYVSVRVLPDDDDDDDDDEDTSIAHDDAMTIGNTVYRSAERTGTLEPEWSPSHDFSVFLGSSNIKDKKILIALHDADANTLAGDDTSSILSYAILSDLNRYKTQNQEKNSIESQHDPYEGLTQPVVLDLIDEENSFTSTTVSGEVWLARAKELSKVNVIRRHCILVYEMRQFVSFVEGFSVAWFMCFQCNPDCTLICNDGDLDRIRDGESRSHFSQDSSSDGHTKSLWKPLFACVPEDTHAPFSHIPSDKCDPKSIKYYDDLAPVSFDELSPINPGERECKSWHQVSTGLNDVLGYSYATSLTSRFWYNEPSIGSLYRRVAWYRYSMPLSEEDNDDDPSTTVSL